MDFKRIIPKLDYSHDFVRVTFETKKLDVVVDVSKDLSSMTATGCTTEKDFRYHLKPSEMQTIKLWVIKQSHKLELIKSLKDDLEDMNFRLQNKLEEVKSMLDEGDEDIMWELENEIKLDYDLNKIEKLLKQNYGN